MSGDAMLKAVILAGGSGTRLKPYTTVFPKPLMPIRERPILEIILRQLHTSGIEEAVIAVGYLAELVMTYCGDGSRFGCPITYSREEKPLGTAGCLGQLKERLPETFLMMNGDVFTTLDYADFLDYHRSHGGIATIALHRREIPIDFGVVGINGEHRITEYTEKPTLSHLVSMGVYAFEPAVLDYIEPEAYLDFPDLIKSLIAEGEEVVGYVYDGYWLDIGRVDDYEQAKADFDVIAPRLGI
jgi:NDP-sugar pyrophosphorylase family protein